MKIAVCTLCINDWYEEIVHYCIETTRNYAKKHGYDFYTHNEVYDGKRECPWYKIKAIQKILNNYDYVFWIDADGFVLKPEQSVEYFIDSYMNKKHLLIGAEFNCTLNTGWMILKNSPYNHMLLDKIWNNPKKLIQEEQGSLCDIYDNNYYDSQNHIEIISMPERHILFSYWSNYVPGNTFFIHLAGCRNDRKGFMHSLDMYCPIKMEDDSEEEYIRRLCYIAGILPESHMTLSSRSVKYAKNFK